MSVPRLCTGGDGEICTRAGCLCKTHVHCVAQIGSAHFHEKW
ncbi:hypothetical protein DA2_2510 [Desulfovibrio sp. A2]|nr:hypothetical protein DA2_2510 [Desulfovibrio sp. A2]